jgi:NADH-quinone oxidoreductase subunit L
MNDEQDMRRYGGLWKQMRGTSICFLAGSLSLAGIIPFVGFFSKDLILGEDFSNPGALPEVLWAVGLVTALLTAFYTGRMWWIAFAGPPSADRPVEHPHEAPPVMMIPVVILALLTTFGGLLQVQALVPQGWALVSNFLQPVVGTIGWADSPYELPLTAATLVLAVVLFLVAYNFYVRKAWRPWSRALPWLQALLERKYYVDELYDALFVRSMDDASRVGDVILEEPLLDGTPSGLGAMARAGAGELALTQNGFFRTYVLVFVGGAAVALILILIVRATS